MPAAEKLIGGELFEILEARPQHRAQNVGGQLVTVVCAARRFRHQAVHNPQVKHILCGQLEDTRGLLFVVQSRHRIEEQLSGAITE